MLDAEKARKELKDILNQKEYRVYDESQGLLASWWDSAKEWIAKKLSALFPSVNISESAAGSILIFIMAVVLLLLALTAFLLFRNHRRNRSLRKQKPLQSMQELNWSFSKHLMEAEKLAGNGEYTGAVRHLFLAILLNFHEKSWLEARIWKTNWEYYEELRKENQKRAEQFYQLALFFDEVTYGERKIGKEEFVKFQSNIMKELNREEKGGKKSIEKG
ncbi:DUF4129 domain-containing protein [Neobacillus mesonae]|uniref:DUF4129 domain-containing protein n=1 Tax=Neobacillus mesonae TaxID=1193713 RepID=UPI00204026CD|nr:DUF4129 domain-containing protein [Neobacillus mesonae]MCM3567688.1 DUF4129 domain-containing protein [Neobacillus mesonae]